MRGFALRVVCDAVDAMANGTAPASVNEEARLFQVWRGSLAVCMGILDKLGRGRLVQENCGEACGALTSLLRGANSAAAELEERCSSLRSTFGATLDVVDELRALVTQQQSALAAREERKRAVRETATSSAAQTDAGESAEERRLRARCAELEDSLVAEREATRIAKVVCETLQRKASRAEDAAADARAAAEAYRTKTSSLERIVDHLEAMVQEKRDVAQSLDESARRRVSYATAPPQAPA